MGNYITKYVDPVLGISDQPVTSPATTPGNTGIVPPNMTCTCPCPCSVAGIFTPNSTPTTTPVSTVPVTTTATPVQTTEHFIEKVCYDNNAFMFILVLIIIIVFILF